MNEALDEKALKHRIQTLIAEMNGELKGEELNMGNPDMMSDNPTIMTTAQMEWVDWATENKVTPTNTQPETYVLMQEAFIDGYVNGFTKRFTEGE